MGYKFTASTLALLIFTFIALAPGMGNGGEVFFNWNMTEEDLQIIPESPDPTPNDIDLSSPVDSENVSMISNSDFNYTDPNFDDYNEVLTVENGTSSGYAIYSTPGMNYARITTQTAGLPNVPTTGVVTPNLKVAFLDTTVNEIAEPYFVAGRVEIDAPNNTQYTRLNLTSQRSGVYEFESLRNPTTNPVDQFFSFAIGVLTFPITLWNMFSEFPFYVQIFYGGMTTWMLADLIAKFRG